jgi:hypothetical protein
MRLGFMSVILLYSDHVHTTANHVAIFRVISERIKLYL